MSDLRRPIYFHIDPQTGGFVVKYDEPFTKEEEELARLQLKRFINE